MMKRIGELNAENARLKAEVEAQAKRWAESEDLISHYKEQRDEAINDCQCDRLKDEVERLTAFTPRTIIPNELLQAQVERLTKAGDAMACHLVCSDLPNDVCGDLMQRWNAAKENLKQLPDSILDFTEEQVRDNPAWALAVFRHRVKEMQYKLCHDINEIGGEQEENARLKAEVEKWESWAEAENAEKKVIKAQVERLTKEGNKMAHVLRFIGLPSDTNGWNAAKEGKQS